MKLHALRWRVRLERPGKSESPLVTESVIPSIQPGTTDVNRLHGQGSGLPTHTKLTLVRVGPSHPRAKLEDVDLKPVRRKLFESRKVLGQRLSARAVRAEGLTLSRLSSVFGSTGTGISCIACNGWDLPGDSEIAALQPHE